MMKNTEQWLVEEECIKCTNYRSQRGIAPSGCKLTGTTLIGKRSADDTKPCPEFLTNNRLNFNHAGYSHKLLNLEKTKKDDYTAFIYYYSTKVKVRIHLYDNSRYDHKKNKGYQYRCINITILEILHGEIQEDLQGFIKFLEYCFDFEIISIQDNKLTVSKRMEIISVNN